MRFDPQANFVAETETVPVAPIVAQPPALGARSPVKSAAAILVIGFVIGIAMWILSEGVPGRKKAAADTSDGSLIDQSIIQYAEALVNGKTEADRVAAATGTSIEQRLTGAARRSSGVLAADEFKEGKLAMGMGNHRKAVEHFTAAIRIDPAYAEAHYRLGLAHVRLGNFTAARQEQAFLKQLGDDRANLLGHLVDN